MTSLKPWAARWWRSQARTNFIRNSLAFWGGFELFIVNLLAYFVPSVVPFIRTFGGWIIALGFIGSFVLSIPKKTHQFKIVGRDTKIELSIRDAFDLPGRLIIPSNNLFDMDLGGNVLHAPSLQGQLVRDHFENIPNNLEIHVRDQLNREEYQNEIVREQGNITEYGIGTTVRIHRNGKIFYLLALTRVNVHGRAIANEDDIPQALSKLWYWISEREDKSDLVIPLVGTGRARLTKNREAVIKMIVRSFIAACSSRSFCDKLTIALHPKDVLEFDIDIEEAINFIDAACRYAEFDQREQPRTGEGIE